MWLIRRLSANSLGEVGVAAPRGAREPTRVSFRGSRQARTRNPRTRRGQREGAPFAKAGVHGFRIRLRRPEMMVWEPPSRGCSRLARRPRRLASPPPRPRPYAGRPAGSPRKSKGRQPPALRRARRPRRRADVAGTALAASQGRVDLGGDQARNMSAMVSVTLCQETATGTGPLCLSTPTMTSA